MQYNDNGINKTLTTGTTATGETLLAPAVAGRSYQIHEFYVIARASTAVDVTLMAGNEELERSYLPVAGSGFAREYAPALPLPVGKGISLVQSGTTSLAYKIVYSKL